MTISVLCLFERRLLGARDPARRHQRREVLGLAAVTWAPQTLVIGNHGDRGHPVRVAQQWAEQPEARRERLPPQGRSSRAELFVEGPVLGGVPCQLFGVLDGVRVFAFVALEAGAVAGVGVRGGG
jgi:hypothetical protein